ncbi:hypothetical protein QN277_016751 [Acacia crassicarpa]|uniref:UBZ4-type domain-containing protein n=1 Tax=Acacia crassicarpa TaxID=499986 RepID=A0AAE1MXB4_9FABA|nr:hypothetical protein QN277_016751 [Acacia crassicarpa]
MAFASDGFSIREYTSKMRSVDVLKCWPFSITSSSDVSKEDLKSCLPPMTASKFQRRPHDLEAARSDHGDSRKSDQQLSDSEISTSESESLKSEKSVRGSAEEERLVCPVCRVFNASTLTAVNAHIDGCLAQTMREERRKMKITSLKPKSKAPKKKKRSIAEIFEVKVEQPQIKNLFKIWPFSKNPDEVSITANKFRWWSRKLEALRSNQSEGESCRSENKSAKSEEKLEMICPVCGAFNAATVTAVNAHIDGCLAQAIREERRQTRMNLKPKPKAAPKKRSIAEILKVAPQIEAKCSDKFIEIEEEKSDNSSWPTASAPVFSTTNSKRNKNTNKKKKKKKKERRWKKKRKAEKHSDHTVKSLNNNGLNAKKEDGYKRKVKSPAKNSRKLKGTIGNKRAAPDDINASAHKKKESLKHASVEKKQKRIENYSSTYTVQDGIEGKTCDVQDQILARHIVTGSDKDNILGPKSRSSSDERMFPSYEQAASSEKEQSSASDDETGCFEVCPVVEGKQFSTPERISPKKILRSCANSEKKRHLLEKFESLTELASDDNDNLNLFDRGNTTALHCSSQSSISRSLSTHQETRVGDSGVYSSPGKFMDYHGDSTHQVSATDSDASTRTFMQPSPSYHTLYSQGSERSLFPSQTCGDNSQTLGYRPLSYMFSANSSTDENLFGLPLNSQGELINFSSCTKVGMNQSETSSMLKSSSSRLLFDNIAYRSSHENLSMNESHYVQKTSQDSINKFPHYPARLGVTELHSSGRAGIHQFNTYRGSNQFVYPLDSDLKPMRHLFAEQNQHDQVQNHKRNEMIPLKKGSDLSSQSPSQPTMRLMGKDVPIGRSIKEVQVHKFEEDVWAEQQYGSTRRNSSGDAALGNSFLDTCSKQDHLSASPFPHQSFLDLQTNHVPQNGNRGFNKTASCYFSHPLTTDSHPSGSSFNMAPQDSPEQSVSGPKFQGLGSHFATCNYSQHACQTNGDLYNRRKLPLVTKPVFEFPLVNTTFGEQAEASFFQSCNRSSQPWLLTHENLPGTSSQQISGTSNISFPHNLWGGLHTGCRSKTEANDTVILEDKRTKDHDLYNNTRKRRATNLHGSTKLIKLNGIEVQENLNGVSGLIQENSSCEFGRTSRAVEVAPRGDSIRSKSCFLNETHPNMMSKSYLGLEISGPGRPSPAIPVAPTSDTGRDLDFPRKLTKIYEFQV